MVALLAGLVPLIAALAISWVLLLGVQGIALTLVLQLTAAVLFAITPGVATWAKLRFGGDDRGAIVLATLPTVAAGWLYIGDAVQQVLEGRMELAKRRRQG